MPYLNLPWMQHLDARTERVVCLVAGRRTGKSTWLWRWLDGQAWECTGRRALLAPTSRLAAMTKAAYGTPLSRHIITGGSQSDWRDCAKIEALAIDEPAHCDPVLVRALMKHARVVRMAGTPRGRDHFWKRWAFGHMSGNWYSYRVSTLEAGLVSSDEMKRLLACMPIALVEQEYGASV